MELIKKADLVETTEVQKYQSDIETVESTETVGEIEVYDDKFEVKVKQAFKLWKHPEWWNQEEHKHMMNDVQELSLFSMFLLLNYESRDQILDFKEIQDHYISSEEKSSMCSCWKSNKKDISNINEKKLFEQISITSDDLLDKFRQYAQYQTMDFREFQKFMEDIKNENQQLESTNLWYHLEDYLFKKHLDSHWYTKCFKCGPCFRKLKKYRMDYSIKDQYLKFLEVEEYGQPVIKKQLTWGQKFTIFMDVYSNFSSLRDLFADTLFVYYVYYASVDAVGTDSEMDYFIVLTISFLALIGPLFGLQSCIISLYFARGDFEPLNLQETGFFTKMINTLQLSFIGGAVTLMFEFINSIGRMMKVLAILLFGGAAMVKKIDDYFIHKKIQLFNLNKFQQESLEIQKQTYTLMFENMPQATIQLLIFLNVFKCEKLVDDNFWGLLMVFISSIFSIIQTFVMAYLSADSVDETTLTYLMSKMSANCNWVPFIHKITKIQKDKNDTEIRYQRNINFSQLGVPFQFSDETLIKLLRDLLLMRKEEQQPTAPQTAQELPPQQQNNHDIQNLDKIQKKHLNLDAVPKNIKQDNNKKMSRLIITQECLQLVSLNAIVFFIQKFPYEIYNLQLYINWKKLYKQKVQEKLVRFKIDKNKFDSIYSPMNEPLLHLCIKDNNSKKRYLREPMKIILKNDKFSPFDTNSGCPIKVAIVNDDFEALKLLLEHKHFPKFTTKDEKGISLYSILFKKLEETHKTIKTLETSIKRSQNQDQNSQKESQDNIELDYQLVEKQKELKELEDQFQFLEESFKQKIEQKLQQKHIEFNMSRKQFQNKDQTRDPLSAWQVIFKNIRHMVKIERTTQILLDQIPKEILNIKLKNYEKMTLFKSSTKLILQSTISKEKKEDSFKSLSKLSEICKLARVDIFDLIDNHNKTFANRFIQNIPKQKQKLEAIFSNIQVFKFDVNDDNSQAKHMIIKSLNDQQLIFDLFKSEHIEMIVNVLEADTEVSTQSNSQQKSESKSNLIINDLNQPGFEALILFQLSKKDMKDPMFKKLMEQVKLRIQLPTYQKIETKIAKLQEIKAQRAKQQKQQEQKIQKDQKREEQLEYESSPEQIKTQEMTDNEIFAKIVQKNDQERSHESSNFEQYLEINQLTYEQKKNGGGQIRKIRKGKSNVKWSTFVRKSIEIILEWIAFGDLVTDFIVIWQLIQTEHKAWTVITIFSLLAPIYASQTSLLMFFKERAYKADQGMHRYKILALGYIMITPLMIAYMLLLDVIFILTEAFLYPIIQLIRLLTCFNFEFKCILNFSDFLYESLFDMKKQDVEGFRRMRIISQLTFETVIQCLLQARMLQYFRNTQDYSENINVDQLANDLLVSLCFSFGHLLLEVSLLYMEALATRTTTLNYAFVCFNGKLGWVPFNDYLQILQQKWFVKPQSQLNAEKQNEKVYLDYENISSTLFGFQMKLKFQFDDKTLATLQKTLDNFPKQERQDQQPVIHFGKTIDGISHETFEKLLQVTDGKFKIDLEGTNLSQIFKNSPYKRFFENDNEHSNAYNNNLSESLKKSRSKNRSKLKSICCCLKTNEIEKEGQAKQQKQLSQDQLESKEKTYLQGLITSKKYQLLDLILQQSGEVILGKHFSNDYNFGEFLVKTIIENKDIRLLQIVLAKNSKQILTYMNKTKVTVGGQLETNWNKLIDLMNYNIWSTLATLSSVFNTQACRDILQAVFGNENSKKIAAQQSIFWHARFGPSFPVEIVDKIEQNKEIIEYFKKKELKYPVNLYVRKDSQFVKVECKTAFKFAKIRNLLVEAWNLTASGPTERTDLSPGSEKNPLDIGQLEIELKDFKLVNMLLSDTQHQNAILFVNTNNIDKLDTVVKKLNLDIHRMYYIGRSRQFQQNRNQIEVTLHGRSIVAQSKDKNQGIQKFKILEMFDQNVNKNPVKDSLVFKLPNNIKFVTKLEIQFETDQEIATQITSTNKCEFFNQSAYQMYKEKNTANDEQQGKFEIEFDSIKATQVNMEPSRDKKEQQIVSEKDIQMPKQQNDGLQQQDIQVVPMLQLENMHPGSEIRINCFPSEGSSFIKELIVKLQIDFGLISDDDMKKARSGLEIAAQKLYEEYIPTKDLEIHPGKKKQKEQKADEQEQKDKKEESNINKQMVEGSHQQNIMQLADPNQIQERENDLEIDKKDPNEKQRDQQDDNNGYQENQELLQNRDILNDLDEVSDDSEDVEQMLEELQIMEEIAEAKREEENDKLKYQQEIQNLNKMVDQAELLKEMHVADDEQRPGQDQQHLDRIVQELESEYEELFVFFEQEMNQLQLDLQQETEQLGKNQQDVEQKLNQSQKINEQVNLAFQNQIELIKSKLQEKITPYLEGQYNNQQDQQNVQSNKNNKKQPTNFKNIEQFQLELKVAAISDVKQYQEIRKHNKTKLKQAVSDMEKDQRKLIRTLEIRVNQSLKNVYSQYDEIQQGLAEIMVVKIDEELQQVARSWIKRHRTGEESHDDVIENYYEELKQNITNYCEQSKQADKDIKDTLKTQLNDSLKSIKQQKTDEVNRVKKEESDQLKMLLVGKNKAEAQEITKKSNEERDKNLKEIQKKYNKMELEVKQENNRALSQELSASQKMQIKQFNLGSMSLLSQRNQLVTKIYNIKIKDLEEFERRMLEALPAIVERNEQLMRQQTIDLLNMTLGVKIGVEGNYMKENEADQFIKNQQENIEREIEEINNFSITDAEDKKSKMINNIESIKEQFEEKKQQVKQDTKKQARQNYQDQIMRIQREKLEEDKQKLRQQKEEESKNLMYKTMSKALKEQEKAIELEEKKQRMEAEQLN